MLIGYVRVSKSDGTQTLEPQRDAMLAAGVDPACIYEDLASGRRDDRPGLAACLKAIQPGNTLVLWKLDRLGRDLRHLVNTVEELRTRGVGLKVLAGAGAQIDTTTANGRLAFGIFAAFAEFERELIAERTMAGLAAARARGRMGGRPRKMDRATLMMAMAAMAGWVLWARCLSQLTRLALAARSRRPARKLALHDLHHHADQQASHGHTAGGRHD
jgi:DNA invertase Pin-like site-specific DNA recombinase